MTDLEKKVKKQIKALIKNIDALSIEEREVEITLCYNEEPGYHRTVIHAGLNLQANAIHDIKDSIKDSIEEWLSNG